MELNTIKELVEQLLTESEKLRGDDDLLYLSVIRIVHPHWNNAHINTNIENAPIGEFFKMRKSAKLPTFESVTRCRRKVQEERPDLKPCEKIQEARKEQEEEFYNFSKLKQQAFDF